MLTACDARDLSSLRKLLEAFCSSSCNYRNYTGLAFKLDGALDAEELRDFTFLSMDYRRQESSGQLNRSAETPPQTNLAKTIFSFVAEGATRALSNLFAPGESSTFDRGPSSSLGPSKLGNAELLARRTICIAAQLTQQYLNSILIT